MDNNFENTNSVTEENAEPKGVAPQSQGATPPPYVGPTVNNAGVPSTPPTVPQQGTSYYDPNSGYMPYAYYTQPKAPAEKKKSKNKKLGTVIAAVIVVISILLLSVLTVYSVVNGKGTGTDNKKPTQNENETVNAEIPFASETEGKGSAANEIYKATFESNVGVLVYSKTQSTIASEGSGVILPTVIADGKDSGKTYIVTCAHVLESSSSYKTVVKTHDGEQYDAKIVGLDRKTDIGVLSINATGLKAAEFASSSSVSVGDTVYALGNPGGSTFFGSFTNGIISAIGRPVNSPVGYEVACIQHTAAINPGNSGGALLNEKGQVIGINSSKIASAEYEGMGFAVPSETVKKIVENIIQHGYVTGRAILGIRFLPSAYSQVHSAVVQSYDLPAGSLIIYSISSSSDLNNKDVKEGDMVIGFNGKKLDDYNELLDFVEKSSVGDTLTLTICRIDQNYKITTFDIDVKLVEDTGEIIENSKG